MPRIPGRALTGIRVLQSGSEFVRASNAYADALQRLLDCYGLFDLVP